MLAVGALISFLGVPAGLLGTEREKDDDPLFAWAALPRTDPGLAKEPRPALDVRAVIGNRDTLVLIFGYAAAIWGSVGLRQPTQE